MSERDPNLTPEEVLSNPERRAYVEEIGQRFLSEPAATLSEMSWKVPSDLLALFSVLEGEIGHLGRVLQGLRRLRDQRKELAHYLGIDVDTFDEFIVRVERDGRFIGYAYAESQLHAFWQGIVESLERLEIEPDGFAAAVAYAVSERDAFRVSQ